MNPDIQRIAAKHLEPYLYSGKVAQRAFLIPALEELSALRDTQERELNDEVELKSLCIKGMSEQADKLAAERDSLRAELARRDEEIDLLKNGKYDDSWAQQLGENEMLSKENASLRSRIGELEDQLEDARNQWLERDT